MQEKLVYWNVGRVRKGTLIEDMKLILKVQRLVISVFNNVA